MSSSSDEPRKRRIKTGKKSVLCSTPLEEACKLSNASPSASTIHTNSTSSIVVRRRLIQRVKAEKKQKPAKAEKERKPAKAKKEQKKKKRKRTKERANRKKPKKPVDSDDWLTVVEQSDDEKENLKQSPRTLRKGLALFQDTTSPERVREAQHFHDYHFDSPIRQRRGDDASPVPVDLGGYEKSLPSENLSHLRIRFDSSDEEEDEKLYFRRSSPVKSYPGARDRRKRKREIRINKSKQWLVNLKVPTVAADTLWDEYVREHPAETREYIAPPAERQEESPSSEDYLISPRRRQNKDDGVGKATKKDNSENWWSKKIWFGQDMPRDRFRTRGHFDRTTRKWVREVIKPDLYSFPGPKDAEDELSKTGASRIRLNEYLQKCKARKDLDSQAAGPSCSRNEQIPNENVKNTKIEQKKTLQRRKSVEDDSSSDTETADLAVAVSLATEWQRFNNLRSYATRLKANEREMSKSVTKSLNEKSLVPAKRMKQEKASEPSTHDSKRTKMADENNAPVVRSVQKLVDKRYIKEKGHWRIV